MGPCTEGKPWGWNVVESAKWESWNQLGNMSSVEAMRLYVKLIDEAQVCKTHWNARHCDGDTRAQNAIFSSASQPPYDHVPL